MGATRSLKTSETIQLDDVISVLLRPKYLILTPNRSLNKEMGCSSLLQQVHMQYKQQYTQLTLAVLSRQNSKAELEAGRKYNHLTTLADFKTNVG